MMKKKSVFNLLLLFSRLKVSWHWDSPLRNFIVTGRLPFVRCVVSILSGEFTTSRTFTKGPNANTFSKTSVFENLRLYMTVHTKTIEKRSFKNGGPRKRRFSKKRLKVETSENVDLSSFLCGEWKGRFSKTREVIIICTPDFYARQTYFGRQAWALGQRNRPWITW